MEILSFHGVGFCFRCVFQNKYGFVLTYPIYTQFKIKSIVPIESDVGRHDSKPVHVTSLHDNLVLVTHESP